MESLERLARARYWRERYMPRILILTFAIVLIIMALTGQLHAEDHGPHGGGFLDERPAWFVKVKVSEKPLRGQREWSQFTGSGTWLTKRHILTCWHNYRDTWGKSRYKHTVQDHKGNEYTNVVILAKDPGADLMLLEVRDKVIHRHTFAVVSSLPESSGFHTCYGIDTDGRRFRYSSGYILADSDGYVRRWMPNDKSRKVGHYSDAMVVPGMSGGPAVNDEGEIMGVNIGHYDGQTSLTSLSTIQKFLSRVELQ